MDICDLWDADIWINPTLIWINPNRNGLGKVEKQEQKTVVRYSTPSPTPEMSRKGRGWGGVLTLF